MAAEIWTVPVPAFANGNTSGVSGKVSVASVAPGPGLKNAYSASGKVLRTLTRIERLGGGFARLLRTAAAAVWSPPPRAV